MAIAELTPRGRLWIFHAQLPQHGENPFLRTIFFKITALLQQPILPVFVFDGPDKPRMKRGAAVGGRFGTHDRHSVEFKRLLEECGLEYWNVSVGDWGRVPSRGRARRCKRASNRWQGRQSLGRSGSGRDVSMSAPVLTRRRRAKQRPSWH
jgi:hypothetical protein